MKLSNQIFVNKDSSLVFKDSTSNLEIILNIKRKSSNPATFEVDGSAKLTSTKGTFEHLIQKIIILAGTSFRLGSCSDAFKSSVEVNFNPDIPYASLEDLSNEILLAIQGFENGIMISSNYLKTKI